VVAANEGSFQKISYMGRVIPSRPTSATAASMVPLAFFAHAGMNILAPGFSKQIAGLATPFSGLRLRRRNQSQIKAGVIPPSKPAPRHGFRGSSQGALGRPSCLLPLGNPPIRGYSPGNGKSPLERESDEASLLRNGGFHIRLEEGFS
jgi:hypothetical protein